MRKIKIKQLKPAFFDYLEYKNLLEVQQIIAEVREKGDRALIKFTLKFDQLKISRFQIERNEIKQSYHFVNEGLILNIEKVIKNLKRFSKKQLNNFKSFEFEIEPGVFVGQQVVPLRRVGIYVPGGRYPLVSSLIMAAIPAKISGVKELVVCSPPSSSGSVHPLVLMAADICGVNEVFRVGGAQAIAAMAYGTESIKAVDKIVGPGNDYVSAAKKIVYGRVGIDFMAGPTETLIMADHSAQPSFLAADLIAQAEHDICAKPIMVTDSEDLAQNVISEIRKKLKELKTADVAEWSIERNGVIVITDSLNEMVEFANKRAPEHLQLCLKNPEFLVPRLKNYGSIFIGDYSPEVLGDYSSGINHILPTNYASRFTSGLGVKDFIKTPSSLKVNKKGFLKIGPVAMSIAEAEGLEGHAHSVKVRLNSE